MVTPKSLRKKGRHFESFKQSSSNNKSPKFRRNKRPPNWATSVKRKILGGRSGAGFAAAGLIIAILSLIVAGIQSYASAVQLEATAESLRLQSQATDAEVISKVSILQE